MLIRKKTEQGGGEEGNSRSCGAVVPSLPPDAYQGERQSERQRDRERERERERENDLLAGFSTLHSECVYLCHD